MWYLLLARAGQQAGLRGEVPGSAVMEGRRKMSLRSESVDTPKGSRAAATAETEPDQSGY